MYDLQHDPRTKQMIKDMLYSYMYEPVLKQFKHRLDTLITQNSVMVGATHNSLTYKGVFYSVDQSAPPRKLNRLDPRLKQQMDEYLEDLKQLNNHELPYVLGFINQVLNSSNSVKDYLDVLPTAIHQPLLKLVETCPCRHCNLTPEKVSEIQDMNKTAIQLLKQRIVTNLII